MAGFEQSGVVCCVFCGYDDKFIVNVKPFQSIENFKNLKFAQNYP